MHESDPDQSRSQIEFENTLYVSLPEAATSPKKKRFRVKEAVELMNMSAKRKEDIIEKTSEGRLSSRSQSRGPETHDISASQATSLIQTIRKSQAEGMAFAAACIGGVNDLMR